MQRSTSPRPKQVHPGRRAGFQPRWVGARHRGAAAAFALGLLAPLGVLTIATPAMAVPSGTGVAMAQGGGGNPVVHGVESWVTDLNTAQRLTPQPVQGCGKESGQPAARWLLIPPGAIRR